MPQRPFVYGTFRWPIKAAGPLQAIPMVLPGEPDIALEILREFSATELIGKLYIRPLFGNWEFMKPEQLKSVSWYDWFEKMPQHFLFDMKGSGAWEVLHFRNESDEIGPYVAVAVRKMSKPVSWLSAARQRDGALDW